MEKYYIEYIISSCYIGLSKKIQFNVDGLYTKQAELEQRKGRLFLTFIFETEIDCSDGISDSQKLIKEILNSIAYNYFKASIGNAYYNDSNLKKAEHQAELLSEVYLTFSDREKKLKNALISNKKFDSDLYSMFRMTMESADVVNRYMFLYQILLDEYGPQQWKADTKIKEICSEIDIDPEYKEWQKDRKETDARYNGETIFTFLRNQVGHIVKGSTPETTTDQITHKLNDLIKIAKYMIDNK